MSFERLLAHVITIALKGVVKHQRISGTRRLSSPTPADDHVSPSTQVNGGEGPHVDAHERDQRATSDYGVTQFAEAPITYLCIEGVATDQLVDNRSAKNAIRGDKPLHAGI